MNYARSWKLSLYVYILTQHVMTAKTDKLKTKIDLFLDFSQKRCTLKLSNLFQLEFPHCILLHKSGIDLSNFRVDECMQLNASLRKLRSERVSLTRIFIKSWLKSTSHGLKVAPNQLQFNRKF